MIQEYKELLLKDLCARLPYSVKVQFKTNSVIENKYKFIYNVDGEYEYINIGKSNLTLDIIKMLSNNCIDDIKPYLFPLSSMTSEQLFEVQEILGKNEIEIGDGFLHIIDSDRNTITYLEILALLEWFYKNHFDVNNLIYMGLAIDATNLNVY